MGPNYLIKLLAFLLFRCWLFTWLTLNSITWTIILPTTSVNLLIFQATKVRPNCFLNYFGFWLDEMGKMFLKMKNESNRDRPGDALRVIDKWLTVDCYSKSNCDGCSSDNVLCYFFLFLTKGTSKLPWTFVHWFSYFMSSNIFFRVTNYGGIETTFLCQTQS